MSMLQGRRAGSIRAGLRGSADCGLCGTTVNGNRVIVTIKKIRGELCRGDSACVIRRAGRFA